MLSNSFLQNCSHDYMMVDFTGDTMFSMGNTEPSTHQPSPSLSPGRKFCGLEAPELVSNGTRMTIEFQSDDLFRYQVSRMAAAGHN